MQINAYIPHENGEERSWSTKMVPNFVYATKEHLRHGVILDELESPDDEFMPAIEKAKHKPNTSQTRLPLWFIIE